MPILQLRYIYIWSKCIKDSKIQMRKRPPLISRKLRHHVKIREKKKGLWFQKLGTWPYIESETWLWQCFYLSIIFHRTSRTSPPFSTCIKEVGSMIFHRLSITTNKWTDQICMKVLKIIWHDDSYANVVL